MWKILQDQAIYVSSSAETQTSQKQPTLTVAAFLCFAGICRAIFSIRHSSIVIGNCAFVSLKFPEF
jgi:hypothetical protein